MRSRYIVWLGFAIVAAAYSIVDTIERSRERRRTLLARLEPFRNAFRAQYVAEEFAEKTEDRDDT